MMMRMRKKTVESMMLKEILDNGVSDAGIFIGDIYLDTIYPSLLR
jgi:hypothetical protein